MPEKRHKHSKKERAYLFQLRGGVCHLCNGRIEAVEGYDISHPIPLSAGGEDNESNWYLAHRKCHRHHTGTVDAPVIAKTRRMKMKHEGHTRPKGTLRGQTFNRRPPQNSATRPLSKPAAWRQ
jgi:5-methylcytosine-specific restriction endonuclease McrA